MKKIIITALFINIVFNAFCQYANSTLGMPDSTRKILTVQASCGECKFHMKGGGCHLAVRIKGKTYFVDGANIDNFGDAHANNGFCKAIRKAKVQGTVVNNRFVVTYFKLL